MRIIYQVLETGKARRIVEMLEAEGITVFINGCYPGEELEERTDAGMLALSVEEDDVAKALNIIETHDRADLMRKTG